MPVQRTGSRAPAGRKAGSWNATLEQPGAREATDDQAFGIALATGFGPVVGGAAGPRRIACAGDRTRWRRDLQRQDQSVERVRVFCVGTARNDAPELAPDRETGNRAHHPSPWPIGVPRKPPGRLVPRCCGSRAGRREESRNTAEPALARARRRPSASVQFTPRARRLVGRSGFEGRRTRSGQRGSNLRSCGPMVRKIGSRPPPSALLLAYPASGAYRRLEECGTE